MCLKLNNKALTYLTVSCCLNYCLSRYGIIPKTCIFMIFLYILQIYFEVFKKNFLKDAFILEYKL